MTKVVSPSDIEPMTRGQISKALDVLGDALRKSGLPSHPTQEVLERYGADLANAYIALLRTRVEAISNMIVRKVRVNRVRTSQEVLDATRRKQYISRTTVVDSMPKGDGDEAEVVFFKPDLTERGGFISSDDLEKEYELRGLKPADPFSVAAVNEVDPAFADEKPHGTQWKSAGGTWCYAFFGWWDDGRAVFVDRHGGGWDDHWWFAGLRK